MKLEKYRPHKIGVAMGIFACVLAPPFGQSTEHSKTNDFSLADAELLASNAYKRAVGREVTKFACHIVDGDTSQWIFVCKDLDESPPPDADSVVLVDKRKKAAKVLGR